MTDSVVIGDTTFTVPTGSRLLASHSHPVLGTLDAQFAATAIIPEGASVAQAGSIAATNNAVQTGGAPGQNFRVGKRDRRTGSIK